MGTIYVLQQVTNKKYYVGQTVRPLQQRLAEHFHPLRGTQKIQRAIRKYGIKLFDVVFTCEGIPEDLLDFFEIELIKRLCSITQGYNLDSGGNKGKHMSTESCLKMKESALKRWPKGSKTPIVYTPEVREKMRQKKLGKPGPWTGKKRPHMSGGLHPNAVSIRCVETQEVFSSLIEIQHKYGFNRHGISDCCHNKKESFKGFHWEFV